MPGAKKPAPGAALDGWLRGSWLPPPRLRRGCRDEQSIIDAARRAAALDRDPTKPIDYGPPPPGWEHVVGVDVDELKDEAQTSKGWRVS